MRRPSRHAEGRRWPLWWFAVPLLVAAVALGSWRGAAALGSPPVATAATARPTGGPAEPQAARVTRAVEPAMIEIPVIGVRAPVTEVGLNGDGTLAAPTSFDGAGWWAGGPAPGEVGSAVIAGHVDSTTGPAVFHRLRELTPGDEITVGDEHGATVTFVVESLEQHRKDDFPTEKVYSGGVWPNLRLVTCGGSFSRSTGHYRDNVIVYARLVGASAPGADDRAASW